MQTKTLATGNRFALLCAVISVATVCAATPAAAQIAFTLETPTQSGTAGDAATLLFRISLSNGALPATINAFSALINTGGGPAPDTQAFADFVGDPATPDPLPAGYAAPLVDFFTATLVGASSGTYTGTASISYDTDGVTLETATQSFTITVAPTVVPEAGGLSLLATGLIFLPFVARRLRAPR